MRKLSILALAAALILSLMPLLSFSTQPIVSVQEAYPILVERGSNFQRWDLGDGKRAWNNAPQWIFNGFAWVPYIYERDNSKKCYTVQSSMIAAEVYDDGHASFYDPSMMDIRVKSETWSIEYWDGKEWKTGSLATPITFNVIKDGNNILIEREQPTSKPLGTLKITYIFREGSALKHEVVWTSDETDPVTVRVTQVWDLKLETSKVNLDNGTVSTDGKYKSTHYLFQSDVSDFLVLESQWVMIYDENGEELTERRFTGANLDFAGKKVIYTFENWTLAQGESLTIDPYTATLDDPTEDGHTFTYDESTYQRNNSGQEIVIGYSSFPEWDRGYIEWDVSSIPDSATITNTIFKYHGNTHEIDCHIHEMLGARPSTENSQAVHDEAGEGTEYANPAGFPIVGTGQEQDLGSSADSDLQSQLTANWFAIGIQSDDEGTVAKSRIRPEDYVSANPKPTLYVEYTIPPLPNAPENLKIEDQTSPQRLTTFTPEMSFLYVDNDGDNMQAFQVQVGTSAGDNSMWDNTTTENAENNSTVTTTYAGNALSRGVVYWWRVKVQDNNDYWSNWSDNENFQINQLPATTNLKTENQTNPTRVTTLIPTFSWVYSDPDGDNQSHWQIWVGTSSGTNDKWNSGEIAGTDNSDVYDGSALSRGNTYYVQVMTKDNFEWSDWATGTFRINQLPTQTYEQQTFYENYTPTLIWDFSDPDGDDQLGIKIQVDNDPGFGSLLWDYSDNTTAAQSKVYAGEALEKNVTYYARVQVRDGYEWSGTWSDNTFEILPISALVVAEVTVDSTPVDRKAHWSGDGDVRIYVTVKDNEGRDAIENVHFWIRDNNDAVVVDNAMHVGYENVNDNTKRLWYDYSPSDVILDNALGEFDVKVQAVSANFENTKDYMDLGFKLFTVDDHSITFSPVREIYAEGEIITFEPVVKSVASGSAVENAYLKLELISELGEVLRTVAGYTNGSGKLATHTTLLEADVGFYDIRISTGKGAIDGQKFYEDAFTVAAELLVSVESITPADDAVSGLLRSRSVVPEDVIVKVLVFDTAGTELLNLISDSMRVENIAPQLKPWQVSYGLTLAEGTYSYRVEVWKADLGTLHHVAFAEVRLAVAPSQQAVGDWLASDTIEIGDEKFDVVLRRESIVTNPETVDKSNFMFKESIPAPQGSTVLVKISGLPATTLTVDQYGMITKYFDVRASTTVKIEMEVTITCAVKIEALGETEVVASSIPRTVKEHEYKVTNLTSTTLRQLELTFPVDDVVSVVDEDGEPLKFWQSNSTAVEIPLLDPYQEITLTLTAEKTSSLPDMAREIITWTIYGIPIIIPLLVLGVILCVILWALTRKTKKKAGPITQVIVLLLPLIIFLGLWVLGVL